MSNKAISIIKRFVKAFVAGGVSALVVASSQTPSLNTLPDLKTWALSLAVAFLSGGLMAIEKAINWESSQTNQ